MPHLYTDEQRQIRDEARRLLEERYSGTALKTLLVDKSDAEVRKFWTAIERGFLPALAGSNADAAAKAYAEITQAYKAHRGIIDEIVKKTNDANAATEADATATVKVLSITVWSVSAFVVLIICAGLIGVARGVVRPIGAMTTVMERLAGDDLEVAIPSTERRDEIGAMARAVQVFKDNAVRVRQMEHAQTTQRDQLEKQRKAEFGRVADEFEATVGRLVNGVSSVSADIKAAAAALGQSAESTLQLSERVAAASELSTRNVSSAAAASEQMAMSVSEIDRCTRNAVGLADMAARPTALRVQRSGRSNRPMSAWRGFRELRGGSARSSR